MGNIFKTLDNIDTNYKNQLNDSITAQNAVNVARKLPYDYNIGQAGKTYKPKINK